LKGGDNFLGLKREVINQVVMPVIQSIVLLVPTGIIGFYGAKLFDLDPWVVAPFVALLCSTYFLLHQFSAKKPWQFPSGKPKRKLQPSSSFELNQNTVVLHTSSNKTRGDFYHVDGISTDTLRRIAFYYIYGRKSLSHDFLDKKMGLLKREDVNKLHAALIASKFAKSQGPKKPIKIYEQGQDCLLSLARLYQPTELEKREFAGYFRRWKY
jgi:hypothetical protein